VTGRGGNGGGTVRREKNRTIRERGVLSIGLTRKGGKFAPKCRPSGEPIEGGGGEKGTQGLGVVQEIQKKKKRSQGAGESNGCAHGEMGGGGGSNCGTIKGPRDRGPLHTW